MENYNDKYNMKETLEMTATLLQRQAALYYSLSRNENMDNEPIDSEEADKSMTRLTKLVNTLDKFHKLTQNYEKTYGIKLEEKIENTAKQEEIVEKKLSQNPKNTKPEETSFQAKMQNLSDKDKAFNIEFYEKVKKKHPKAIYDLKKRMITAYKMQGIEKRRQDITHEECEAVADYYLKNLTANKDNLNLS